MGPLGSAGGPPSIGPRPKAELSDWYTIELLFKAGEAEAEAFCDLVAEAVYGTPAHSGPLGGTGAAVSMTRHTVEDWQNDD